MLNRTKPLLRIPKPTLLNRHPDVRNAIVCCGVQLKLNRRYGFDESFRSLSYLVIMRLLAVSPGHIVGKFGTEVNNLYPICDWNPPFLKDRLLPVADIAERIRKGVPSGTRFGGIVSKGGQLCLLV